MIVSNDTPQLDFIDYIKKQFKTDLLQMIELRSELAKRQGAMSAVENAVADREAAAKELDAAKAEAKAIKEDAANDAAKAKKALADVKARETAVANAESALEQKVNAVEADLATRTKACDTREAGLEKQADDLAARKSQLDADIAAHAARVKEFQAKVASLTA